MAMVVAHRLLKASTVHLLNLSSLRDGSYNGIRTANVTTTSSKQQVVHSGSRPPFPHTDNTVHLLLQEVPNTVPLVVMVAKEASLTDTTITAAKADIQDRDMEVMELRYMADRGRMVMMITRNPVA